MELDERENSLVSDEDFGNIDSSSESSETEFEEESSESGSSTQADSKMKKKNKKKQLKKPKKAAKPRIIFNVSDTQYDVVKYVGKKIFNWKLSYDRDSMEWDIFWTDNTVQPETLARMQAFQKINHFPGMYSLARKNHLGRNLMRMKRTFPESYKFFPQTFLLPSEYNEFRNQFNKKKAKTFIIKPEASCQGRGIFLTRNFESVQPGEHYVAQRYLHKPYLIDGLKFDLRIYVLLAGCDPLKIFLYDDGLGRFATEEYVAPSGSNLDNVCMHLTNYAINKDNPNFVFNESSSADDVGHKRSLKAVFRTLRERGHDVDKLWREIKKIIIKTFCSVQPILAHSYKSCHPDEPYNNMCFELLGFDVMLDHKLKPWLIEVNHTPSFTTDTPLDKHIKKSAIRDALTLMNISLENKMKTKNKKRQELQQRVLTGKKLKMTPEERQAAIEKAQRERDEWESKNHGRYEKIYPLSDLSEPGEDYEEFMKVANKWWEEWTGTSIKRNIKKSPETNKPPPMIFGQGPSSMASRTKDIQNIYSQKLKPSFKPNSVQSQRGTQPNSKLNEFDSPVRKNSIVNENKPNKTEHWEENYDTVDLESAKELLVDEENKDFMKHLHAIKSKEAIDVIAEDYQEQEHQEYQEHSENKERVRFPSPSKSYSRARSFLAKIGEKQEEIEEDVQPNNPKVNSFCMNETMQASINDSKMAAGRSTSFRIKAVYPMKDMPQKSIPERSTSEDTKLHFLKRGGHTIPVKIERDLYTSSVGLSGQRLFSEKDHEGRNDRERELSAKKMPLKLANGIIGTVGMLGESTWSGNAIVCTDGDREPKIFSAANRMGTRIEDAKPRLKKKTLIFSQQGRNARNYIAPKMYELTFNVNNSKDMSQGRPGTNQSTMFALQGFGLGNKATAQGVRESNSSISQLYESQVDMQRYYYNLTRQKK